MVKIAYHLSFNFDLSSDELWYHSILIIEKDGKYA